ncbi:hypothetical protein GCM10028833_02210 [Glycomyces tarimensis]
MAAWAGAAAVAVAAGVGAVALAQGGSLSSPTEPMSEEQVQAQLDEALSATPDGSPSAEASPSASPSPEVSDAPVPTGQLDEVPGGSADSGEEVFSGDGGTFLARCSGAQIELVWWSAAQGWQVSSVDAGPGEDVEIEFEGAGEEEYTASCADGGPRVNAQSDDDGDDDD